LPHSLAVSNQRDEMLKGCGHILIKMAHGSRLKSGAGLPLNYHRRGRAEIFALP
jgi:hypothetical protein